MSGRPWTEDEKRRKAVEVAKYFESESNRNKTSEATRRGMELSNASAKLSALRAGREVTLDTKKRIAIRLLGNQNSVGHTTHAEHTIATRELLAMKLRGNKNALGHSLSCIAREWISETARANFLKPEFVEMYVRTHSGTFRGNANDCELMALRTLNNLQPGLWEYTGNLSFWLGHRNPDLTNRTNKLVVEIFGLYWHDPLLFPKRPSEPKLTAHYAAYGFRCLVLWEDEVLREDVMLRRFEMLIGGAKCLS